MIYTVTLNPAIDRIMRVQGQLVRGKNNRVSCNMLDIGGKGTHVSVVLSILNTPNIATGFAGEGKKDILYKLLKEQNVDPQFYILEGKEIRENYVLMDESNTGSFMITHTGPEVTKKQVESFVDDLSKKLTKDDFVVFAGNPSKYMSAGEYLYILKEVKKTGAKVIVDASGDYLKAALKIQPTLIKPNQFELSELTGMKIHSIDDCFKAYQQFDGIDMEYLVVTLGKQGAILFHQNGAYHAKAPRVETVNDTGCGDAFVGGLVYGLYHHHSIEDILVFATAISASKAMQITSSGFEVKRANELRKQVVLHKMID
ncbi:tagatose-6-phosphate kinase [Robertmurraya siralis]|uniref:Tagatose-6-phosphate kinase n=1 Tax=Robertmurraya siralis TaxID=77777 RepID=A0A919WJ36_9BACI|nr:1-phosphofructokinase family hexose kinase [Robertmurraya siralis]GIN62624.1 tagatose-6-phosphate kinase [Robertmurraya siralis]